MKFPKLFSKKLYVYHCPDCDNVIYKSKTKDVLILDDNNKPIKPIEVIPNNYKPDKPENPNFFGNYEDDFGEDEND